MLKQFKNNFIEFITTGTRPFRIFLFGGIFLALIIMNVLALILGINTSLGGDMNLENFILIITSIFLGFGISYSVIHLAGKSKRNKM